MFLQAVSRGGYPLTLQDGDVLDAVEILRRIADDPSFSWSDPKAHGGPEERQAAMARGWLSADPRLCAAYERTGQILVTQIGSYSMRLPPAATLTPLTNTTSTRFATATEPELTTDLTSVPSITGVTAVEALTAYVPTYFGTDKVRVITAARSYDPMPTGLTAAEIRYEKQSGSGPVHGVLVMITRKDGSAMLVDTFAKGPAPAGNSGDWNLISEFVLANMFGVS